LLRQATTQQAMLATPETTRMVMAPLSTLTV
jgi:hypothetical protein